MIARHKTLVLAAFDPGLSGAVAISTGWGSWDVTDLPTMGMGKQVILNGAELTARLRSAGVTQAVVERVHSMPDQGVAGVFKFGTAFGQILGVLQAAGIRYDMAEPAKWKREMKLPGGKGKQEAARGRAIELFPEMQAYLARKKDHNRAEALLLGLWWLDNWRKT